MSFVMLWLIVFVNISCCRYNLMVKFMNYDSSRPYSLVVINTNRGHLATFDMLFNVVFCNYPETN